MRTFVVFLALVFAFSAASAQLVTNSFFRVPLVVSEVDTIPGTESGGVGNGGAGWFYVGTDDVEYSLTSQDSMGCLVVTFDYADSAYASASGSSAKVVGFKSATRTVNEDSVSAPANVANPKQFISNVLRCRDSGTDKIKGARWIRCIITADANQTAGAAADRTVTLILRRLHYPGR